MIRRWWWLIILMGLLAAAAVYAATSRMPPVYKSSATLLISPAKNSTSSQYNDLLASARLASTYSEMLKDRTVLNTVKTVLKLEQSTDELSDNITATSVRDTQLIRITVTDTDPVQAALIANTVAETFKMRVEALSAERYAEAIKNAKARVNILQTRVDDTESGIGTLRSEKVVKDVQLADKQSQLNTLRNDFLALQNNQLQLELSIAGATGGVYVFEPLQLRTDFGRGDTVASSVISVGQVQAIGGTSPNNDNLALTYGRLIIKRPLFEKIIKDLNLKESPDQLAQRISVDPVNGTQLIRLTARDLDPTRAETIGKALVSNFIEQVKDLLAEPYGDRLSSIKTQLSDTSASMDKLQGEIAQLTADITKLESEITRQDTILSENRADFRQSQRDLEDVQITAAESSDTVVISEPAQAPKLPNGNGLLYVVVGAMVGLALGAGLALFFEFLDDRIRVNQDLRKELNLATLGRISRFSHKAKDLVMVSEPASIPADDFRVLSSHIRRLYDKHKVRTLLITSPSPMDGKSVIVSNLALALANTGLEVIAVDGDLRLPRLHQIFKLGQEYGLSNTLSSGYLNGSLQETLQARVKVLTSGPTPENPAELLTSPELKRLVAELAELADIVLFDCPPVLTAADASILAQAVDGVLLVLKLGQSNHQAAKRTVDELRQVKANIIGVVLNAVPERKEGYYKYYRKAAIKR